MNADNYIKYVRATNKNNNIIYVATLAIFFLIALNSLFNSLAVSFGATPKFTTFLMLPNDLFADYFKSIFSFITTEKIDARAGNWDYLNSLIKNYISNNPYRQIDQLTGLTSNLHGMPMSTAFCLINLHLMQWVNSFNLFKIVLIFFVALNYLFSRLITKSIKNQIVIFILLTVNYPFLFIVTRGHFFSALTTLTLLLFLIFIRRQNIPLAAIFLAIACNIRPNAVIFLALLPMIILNGSYINAIKFLCYFLTIAACLFLASLGFCEYFYPNYNFQNFITAIGSYNTQYAIGDAGLAFGSSLAGALKFLFGYVIGSQLIIAVFVLFMITLNTIFFVKKKINLSCYLFNTCAFYVLATPVFADYYLGIFLGPILYIFLESEIPTTIYDFIVIIGSVLILSPKNYIFRYDISFQVFLNPCILLIVVFTIFALAVLNKNSIKKSRIAI